MDILHVIRHISVCSLLIQKNTLMELKQAILEKFSFGVIMSCIFEEWKKRMKKERWRTDNFLTKCWKRQQSSLCSFHHVIIHYAILQTLLYISLFQFWFIDFSTVCMYECCLWGRLLPSCFYWNVKCCTCLYHNIVLCLYMNVYMINEVKCKKLTWRKFAFLFIIFWTVYCTFNSNILSRIQTSH